MPNAPDAPPLLGLGLVFTLLFVTLGPLKILGPFAQQTHEMPEQVMKKVAVRAFVLALIAVVAGGFLGQALLENWDVPASAMELAGGAIFLLVGLNLVLEQYKPAHATPPPLPEEPMAAAMRITFPMIVTPYGIAALIVLLVNSHSVVRTMQILAILVGVMVLNLAAMLYGRRIMGGITVMALQILGAVLGVLQVALAMEMIKRGLQGAGLMHA